MWHSLRARLALWLLLPLAVLVALCGWFAHEHAEDAADYVQDHDLLSSAKILADRLIWEDGDVHASVPPSALSLFMSPARDQVYLSVTDAQGQLLAGQPDFPQPTPLQLTGADNAQWYDAVWQGQPIRSVVTRRAMYDVAGAREITIMVGKTTHSRDNMVQTLWWPTMEYLLSALVIAIVVTATALTLELRPLLRMARQLAGRPAQDVDFHLDSRQLHQELRPLADTVNQFARTIRAQVARQRQFISDAAHQLRTPLAVQSTVLQQALAPHAAAPDQALLQRLARSNQQLVNIAQQLLTLAQAEQHHSHQQPQWVDLQALCLQCLENLAPAADHKHLDLGWDLQLEAEMEAGVEAGMEVEADRPGGIGQACSLWTASRLLPELIANLVDNAIRYTPAGGHVTLGLIATRASLTLWVADDGPGIPASSRDQVFERFYRIAQDGQGTGLGLAIVQEIARATGAAITLNYAHGQPADPLRPGLRVAVCFPRSPTAYASLSPLRGTSPSP